MEQVTGLATCSPVLKKELELAKALFSSEGAESGATQVGGGVEHGEAGVAVKPAFRDKGR